MIPQSSRVPLLLAALCVVAFVFFGGCTPPGTHTPSNGSDQCLRAQLFKECLAAVPKGPASVVNSNDWDEVVDSCENSAYYQSIRSTEHIKPECRSR